jgi:PPOX class probable F420-dependent enzyme
MMQPEEREALLAKPLDAILAIPRPAAGPQLTPLWFYWDGQAFYFSTTRSRAKYPNLKRNSEVSVIVDDLAAHHYLTAYGRAEIVEGDRQRIVELTRPIMTKYMPDKAERAVENLEADRVIIVLRPARIVTN